MRNDTNVRGAHATSLSGGNIGAFGFSFGLEFTREVEETKTAQHKLVQLVRRLSATGHGTVILIDELQANSPEVRQIMTVYQEMVGEGLNVALVMAGLPAAVAAALNDRVLTFLNRARKISLTPLPISDVDAFNADAFEQPGLGSRPPVGSRHRSLPLAPPICCSSLGTPSRSGPLIRARFPQRPLMTLSPLPERTLRATCAQPPSLRFLRRTSSSSLPYQTTPWRAGYRTWRSAWRSRLITPRSTANVSLTQASSRPQSAASFALRCHIWQAISATGAAEGPLR